MNQKAGGDRGLRRAAAWAVAAAIAATATGCSVQTSTSYLSGPVGSATYRQETAFAQCMRRHGARQFPDPIPGGSITVEGRQNGACRHLLPSGAKTTIRITVG
jgi:hypothetical protein